MRKKHDFKEIYGQLHIEDFQNKRTFNLESKSSMINKEINNKENILNFKSKSELNKVGASDYIEYVLDRNGIVTYQNIDKYLNENKEKFNLEGEISYLIKYVEELEMIQKEIRQDLAEMKEAEIKRIVKEFLTNDYEGIYRVNISTIFSVIVGEQNLFHEMKKYLSEKLNYYKSLELCRNHDNFNRNNEFRNKITETNKLK